MMAMATWQEIAERAAQALSDTQASFIRNQKELAQFGGKGGKGNKGGKGDKGCKGDAKKQSYFEKVKWLKKQDPKGWNWKKGPTY